MKKCLLSLILLVTISHAFAFTTQGHWRWRKDDGNETTATYLAAENITPLITTYDNIRIRAEVYNNTGDPKVIDNTTLAYSETGLDNTWILITDTAANKAFVLAASTSVADGQATTQQLSTRAGYTFQAGRVISSQAAYTYTMANKTSTEFEFVIKPTATAKLNKVYYFETSVGGYDIPLPSLTTGSVLPVTLTSFSVSATDNKALVKWTTANEVNNDHFEVLRSSNGQSWQSIATVKAKGNATQSSYDFTDNTPLSGNSYYRLKQVDRDGKAVLSDVKNFSLKDLRNAVASIYPNPTTAAINVMLNNYTGSVTATVTNTQGAVVYRQIFAATAATSAYKLNVNQKLASGTYYVNLSGTNLSQKLKVIVQ